MIQKKICMLGAFAVGKTSLIARYMHSVFSEKYQTTVGVKIDKKEISVDDQSVTLILWDLYGEDDFMRLRTSYLRGAVGCSFWTQRQKRKRSSKDSRLHMMPISHVRVAVLQEKKIQQTAGNDRADGWLDEKFLFLTHFLEDAIQFWEGTQNGRLKSGLWQETDVSGDEYLLEASALLIDGRQVLLIEGVEDEERREAHAESATNLNQRLDQNCTVRALVVDDGEENREVLEGMLTHLGIETEIFEHGRDALNFLKKQQPDIVFLDIHMPEMDGVSTMVNIWNLLGRNAVPIVAVSASVLAQERRRYLAAGFDAFLDKPVLGDKLCACLTERLGVTFTET